MSKIAVMILLAAILSFCVLAVYACIVVGGEADRAQEAWAEKLFDSDNGQS